MSKDTAPMTRAGFQEWVASYHERYEFSPFEALNYQTSGKATPRAVAEAWGIYLAQRDFIGVLFG